MPAMRRSGSRRLFDGMTSMASLGVVVAGMAVMDEMTRGYLVRIVEGDFRMSALMPNVRVHKIMEMVTDVGQENAALVVFAGVAAGLFVLMFRT
jgi:hypothetical protein